MPLFFVYNGSLNQEFNQIKQRIKMLKRTRNQLEYIRELVDIIEQRVWTDTEFIIEAEKRGYTPFICGISNTNDVDKMPLYIYVCAGLGSEQVVRYEKVVT